MALIFPFLSFPVSYISHPSCMFTPDPVASDFYCEVWFELQLTVLPKPRYKTTGCLTLLEITEILEICWNYFSFWKSWKSCGHLQNLLEIFWPSSCVCCYYDSQFLYFKTFRWKHLAAVTVTVSDGWMTL